jgi:hypothetical protein|tara:strand:- start:598 stop:1218 length:621 start_codon:yes stop_codon:yes gene_type:complete
MKELNVFQKLNIVQTSLKVEKGHRNNFGNYNYRNLADIFEGVKPLLNELGCFLTVDDEIVCINGFNYIKATATFSDGNDSISVRGWARESVTKKGMDDSQITGATSSYARKYACNGLFAIDDTKDADSMDNREETLINGQKPVKGHITVDQNVKLERLSRNPVFNKTDKDKAKKVRSFIDKNPTEEQADAAIEKIQIQIKEQKEAA